MSVLQTACALGVSRRMVYELAASSGPIPCVRIGRRVLFDDADVTEYIQQCRYTETKRAVSSSLSSVAVSADDGSALERYFLKRGVRPKLMPSNAKSPRGFTRLQVVSSDRKV